jgi:hypothetical protein
LSIAALSIPAQEVGSSGSITGSVLEAGTGRSTPDAAVFVHAGTQSVQTQTGSNGHYEFREVAPGLCRIAVYSRGRYASRTITLVSGQHLGSIDFHLEAYGYIAGKVVDENKEPLSGIGVFLVGREYQLGALRYVFSGVAKTDDRGEYSLPDVEPGRGFLILAQARSVSLPAISDEPSDPARRKKVPASTWFGDSDSIDGAEVVTLSPGERREGVEIRMSRSPSYCVEGVLDAEGVPAALGFFFQEEQPTTGASGDRAMYLRPPYGRSGADGRIRLCKLHPGVYRLTAFGESPPLLGTVIVVVAKGDVRKFRVSAHGPAPILGEVAWAGRPPDQPLPSKLRIGLQSRLDNNSGGRLEAESDVPGGFSFGGVLADEYSVRVRNLPPGVYIKDVTYGGSSVLHLPLRVGSVVASSQVRILLATDGGAIATRVADKDGNVVPDCSIAIIPAESDSAATLADALVLGQTDQYGAYSSPSLAPGKYYVLATTAHVTLAPESIGKLSRALNHAQEIDLGAGVHVQVSLSPVSID